MANTSHETINELDTYIHNVRNMKRTIKLLNECINYICEMVEDGDEIAAVFHHLGFTDEECDEYDLPRYTDEDDDDCPGDGDCAHCNIECSHKEERDEMYDGDCIGCNGDCDACRNHN